MLFDKIIDIYKTFGWRDLSRRLIYELDNRSGFLRNRTPIASWHDTASYQGEVGDFFFSAKSNNSYKDAISKLDIDMTKLVKKADSLIAGSLTYFSSLEYKLQFPPDWHYHPNTKANFPKDRHWTEIPDLSPELGDIKMVWEMSRFSFVFTLVRAYYATGDEKYAEAFWHAIESWLDDNPPNQGANWKCGQEVALRSIAWYFGYFAFADSSATNDTRTQRLFTALALQAERIEQNIRYALSQRNNHGVSEAVGLWTAGLLLQAHPRAKIWQRKGKGLLESLAQEQIYPDGAYAQHSFNYQRLMLSLYLWAIRLGEVNEQPLSDALHQAVYRSVDLLYNLQDEATGQLPNYGSNDGALLFPLSSNDYQDYRPILQAMHYVQNQQRTYAAGAQDELLWWFWGDVALEKPSSDLSRHDVMAQAGGYYTLRGKQSFAFTRAASYRHRPHQADNLHVDIWHKGINVAFDPGTYSYNSPEPWRNGLVHTHVHNTVTVDGRNQMQRGSRFLWYNWLTSDVAQKVKGEVTSLELAHSAYSDLVAPVQHRRVLLRVHDSYICIDRLQSVAAHDYQLTWNLWDRPQSFEHGVLQYETPWKYQVQLLSSKPFDTLEVVEAQDDSVQAWRSTKYAVKEPAHTLVASLHAHNAVMITAFNHDKASFQDGRAIIDLSQGRLVLELSSDEDVILGDVVWEI